MSLAEPTSIVLLLQGFYFLLTGVWPLLSMRTFEAVTGEKHDKWLVKTVGVLVVVMGLVMLSGIRDGWASPAVYLLAVGGALGQGAIDVWYVLRRVIPPIYLADAVLETIFVAAWAILLLLPT